MMCTFVIMGIERSEMKSKIFSTEEKAKEFAKKVNGIVKMKDLPDYMRVLTVWVVEWKGGAK